MRGKGCREEEEDGKTGRLGGDIFSDSTVARKGTWDPWVLWHPSYLATGAVSTLQDTRLSEVLSEDAVEFIRMPGVMDARRDGRGCLWSSLCQSNMAALSTHCANYSPSHPVLEGVREMPLGITSTLPGDSVS